MTIRRARSTGFVLGLLGLTALAGCTIASGPRTTESRPVTDVAAVQVESGIRVEVTLGTPAAATVTAPEDAQELIALDTVDGVLRIHLDEPLTTTAPIEVALTVTTLTGIEASGGAAVEVDDLAVDGLTVATSGGARVTASGTAGSMTLEASGGSRQELAEIVAGSIQLAASGGAVILVQATDAVSGSASGGSRVNVAGPASVRVETSGGASLETE